MRQLIFVTHAEVNIDPEVPVPEWSLSETGRARHHAFAERCPPISAVFSSFERKAIDGAEILAGARGLEVKRVLSLHENDRSATGYLPPEEFEQVADAFFANPRERVRGWERAMDAQARIVMTLKRLVAEVPDGDFAVVAHGGIGALLRAHLLGVPIDRTHDQPAGGGGHGLVVALPAWRLLQDWQRIESFDMQGPGQC